MSKIILLIIAWFSKPKKVLTVAPDIKPCVVKVGGKLEAWYVVTKDFTIGKHKIPAGRVTNGRSGGVLLSSLVGSDAYDPNVLAACIAHDCKYDDAIAKLNEALKTHDKQIKAAAMNDFRLADNEFYDDLRENNRHIRCTLFFLAVRFYSSFYFGVWRWYIGAQISTVSEICEITEAGENSLKIQNEEK
jgi:hypothetical protein